MRNSPTDMKVREGGGAGGASDAGAMIFLQTVQKTMVERISILTAAHGVHHTRADRYCED